MIRSAYQDSDPSDDKEFGTQFIIMRSLTRAEQASLRFRFGSKIEYSEDGLNDNVFINVDADSITALKALFKDWGIVEE